MITFSHKLTIFTYTNEQTIIATDGNEHRFLLGNASATLLPKSRSFSKLWSKILQAD